MDYYSKTRKRIEEATEYINSRLNGISMTMHSDGTANFFFKDWIDENPTFIPMTENEKIILRNLFNEKINDLTDFKNKKALERL